MESDDSSSSSSLNYRLSSSSKSSVEKNLPKYSIEKTKKLDLITYESVLIINDVTGNDYGPYECIARNDLGFDAMAIALNRTSRPDSPRSLRVVNVTSGSVTLRWLPGFDGGLRQTFRIRYRPIDSLSMINDGEEIFDSNNIAYMYRDVYPTNATTIIVGGLRDNTQYIFNVMAINEKGDSDYSADIVKASTLKGMFLHLFLIFVHIRLPNKQTHTHTKFQGKKIVNTLSSSTTIHWIRKNIAGFFFGKYK